MSCLPTAGAVPPLMGRRRAPLPSQSLRSAAGRGRGPLGPPVLSGASYELSPPGFWPLQPQERVVPALGRASAGI